MTIQGLHAIMFATVPDEVRAFFADVLALHSVDAGGGWPIFALPPAELAVHPAETNGCALYLMCDDLEATMRELSEKGVAVSGDVSDEPWGSLTYIELAGGSRLGLYQPRHPTPLDI